MDELQPNQLIKKKKQGRAIINIGLGGLIFFADLKFYYDAMLMMNLLLQLPTEYWNAKLNFMGTVFFISSLLIIWALTTWAVHLMRKGIRQYKEAKQ